MRKKEEPENSMTMLVLSILATIIVYIFIAVVAFSNIP